MTDRSRNPRLSKGLSAAALALLTTTVAAQNCDPGDMDPYCDQLDPAPWICVKGVCVDPKDLKDLGGKIWDGITGFFSWGSSGGAGGGGQRGEAARSPGQARKQK